MGTSGRTISEEEFEDLYRATAAELFGYLRRRQVSDPEDLVAETFAIAWRRRGDLPPAMLRRAWIFGTARNLLLDQARRHGRESAAQQAVAQGGDGAPSSEEPRVEQVVAQALGRLRPQDRELIQLVEWEQLSISEVAVVLGLRPGATRVRLHRARQRLAADPQMQELVGRVAVRG